MKKLFAILIALLMFCSCATEEQEKPVIPEEPEIPVSEEIETQEVEKTEEGKTDEEIAALYEEIIINFGGKRDFEGKLAVRKGPSFYYNTDGVADYSVEDPMCFYSWIMSRTSVEDRIEVSIPGFSGNVYAYSADFFESEVYKYFGRTAESLRVSNFYYPEQNCYYLDGHGGMGDVPYILVNSIDEDGDLIIFHITLDYSSGDDYNMALTVKLFSDGGYNYISYLGE